MMLFVLLSLHFYNGYKEEELLNKPYQNYQYNGLTVQYKGVSIEKVENYANVYKDITQIMESFGVHNIPYHTLKITRVFSLPDNNSLENIISSSGDIIEIRPYSNKFFEFNYGYNITEDMINTLMGEQWETKEQTNCYEVLKRTIEQKVIYTNKSMLFSEAKKKSVENLLISNEKDPYMEKFLHILQEEPKNAYLYIKRL